MSGPAAVRLRPVEYVQLYGPPERRCSDCEHTKPEQHAAGGRLDRLVLQDIASWASWRRDDWGERTFPSVPEIARRIGYSDRSVQYAMRRLERCGFIERVERPGFTSLCRVVRVVEPVDERADVVNFAAYKRRPSRRRNAPLLHHSGATVAPELGALPEEQPPQPPDSGWEESDGAARRLSAAPDAPRGGRASTGTAPPSAVAVGAEPHRRMRGGPAVPERWAPSLDDVPTALSVPCSDDPPVERASRSVTRSTRRCPRCGAPPGESCHRPNGKLRRANHAERRPPRL